MLPSSLMQALSIVLIVTLSGCFKWNGPRRRDPALEMIRAGQRLFDQRGEDPAMIDQAIDVWMVGLEKFPQSPRLLARLSRAWIEKASTKRPLSPEGFYTARQFGVQCMMSDPVVNNLIRSAGRVNQTAINEATNVACLSWTAIAWAGWVRLQGPGASIDLPTIEAIARRAVALNPGFQEGLPRYALGLALALPPEPLSPDFNAAESELKAAMDAAPERWMVTVDWAELVLGPQGKKETFRSVLQDLQEREVLQTSPEAYWNRAAQTRATELLRGGPQVRWSTHAPQ